MNKKFIGTALVAVLVIAIIGLFLPTGNPITQRIVGAVSTLDGVDNPFVSINGRQEWWGRVGIDSATSSVVCAIKNPYGATSTIKALSLSVRSNGLDDTTVSNKIVVSTSTSAFGSSTAALVHDHAIQDAFSFSWVPNTATSTGTGPSATGNSRLLAGMTASSTSAYVLGPSEWITFKMSTSSAGTFASYMAGSCAVQISLD